MWCGAMTKHGQIVVIHSDQYSNKIIPWNSMYLVKDEMSDESRKTNLSLGLHLNWRCGLRSEVIIFLKVINTKHRKLSQEHSEIFIANKTLQLLRRLYQNILSYCSLEVKGVSIATSWEALIKFSNQSQSLCYGGPCVQASFLPENYLWLNPIQLLIFHLRFI